jgi:chemotaxis signal transduction protein
MSERVSSETFSAWVRGIYEIQLGLFYCTEMYGFDITADQEIIVRSGDRTKAHPSSKGVINLRAVVRWSIAQALRAACRAPERRTYDLCLAGKIIGLMVDVSQVRRYTRQEIQPSPPVSSRRVRVLLGVC